MTIERLRRILEYGKTHSKEIEGDIEQFCQQVNLQTLNGVRDVLQIVSPYLIKRKYLVIQIPLRDDEIGAFVYKGDALSYLVINTSMPVLNTNFALCHELYHVFFPAGEELNKARIDLDYYSNEDEIKANIFAGNLLMPKVEFANLFSKLKLLYTTDSEKTGFDEFRVVVALMHYFKAPFMAVYIRCYELELIKSCRPKYLDIDSDAIKSEFEKLWFDISDLKPSKADTSDNLLQYVKQKGDEYIQKNYVDDRTLQIVLENIKTLFSRIKAVV